MKIHMMPQLSDLWWEARRGFPTASGFDRILTPGGKPSAQQDDYIAELIADIRCLTPNYFTEKGTPSRAMQHGIDCEPEARLSFTLDTGLQVQQVGGCVSDCGRFWSSPDGMVPLRNCDPVARLYEAALELKCPQMKTQVKYLLDGQKLPKEYAPQCHGHLIITGLPACHFYSYCPGLPPLHVVVEPDEFTKKLADELERFHEKFRAALKRIGGAA